MADLKVIGVGYPRTGTSSMKIALDRLGFQCYHMFEIFNRPSDISAWLRMYDETSNKNRKHEFDKIFADYKATIDFPSVHFYRELIEYYPNAKIILTLRDANSWFDNYQNTIQKGFESIPCIIGHLLTKPTFYKMIRKVTYSSFGTLTPDRQCAIEAFEKHNLDVLKYVPAERLLVYRVEKGWKPLCDFLNVPVPDDTPFPYANDRKQMQKMVDKEVRTGWLFIILCFIIIAFIFQMFCYGGW